MKRDWWYRFVFLMVIFVFCIMGIIPTVFDFKEDSKFPVKSKINLGLDLQGGLYMVLGIDFNKVYKDEVSNYARKIVSTLKDESIIASVGTVTAQDATDPKVEIILSNVKDSEKAKSLIKEFYSYPVRFTHETGASLEYGISKQFKEEVDTNAVSKSIEVIRNRIDEFGVTEPEIVSLGKDRIVIQLPGVKDIDRAKELIGKTAKLEFKFVNDDVGQGKIEEWVQAAEKDGIVYKKGERFSEYVAKINNHAAKEIPKDHQIVFSKKVNKLTNELESKIPYLVEAIAPLGGDDLQDAIVRIDQQKNMPYVGITFKPQGAKIFEEVTGKNVGRRMSIILDSNVYSDPVIQERIGGGQAQITLGRGGYDEVLQQARDLALVLRAGALPVELDFQEQRIVGPSLGAESIEKSKLASMLGALFVFLFIILYYKISGFIAITTLVVNLVIILGALVGLEATLTLPGIAGIALTIGMAVDANIIIYERIKEEKAIGAPNLQAVDAGFGKAFWTIVDANLTTAVAGLALLNFGTGPIRGFAVTLIIGIVATVYASYFVGKLFFELYMDKVKGTDLSI